MAQEGELAVRAIAAAEYLFEEDEPDGTGGLFEPSDERTARAAITRFGELFAGLRGVPKSVMERARNSGDLVSSDPLQGLAEIVQNSDDVEATEIVLQLSQGELLVSHNGNPVRLPRRTDGRGWSTGPSSRRPRTWSVPTRQPRRQRRWRSRFRCTKLREARSMLGCRWRQRGWQYSQNAQFDPTTSRQEFPDNQWNKALVAIVAELWSAAVLDAFDRDPRSAWQAIPIGEVPEDQRDMPIVRRLESEVIASAREWVAANLTLPVAGRRRLPLRELAVEDKPLARVLTPEETAGLAGLRSDAPGRDPRPTRKVGGRCWRTGGPPA